MKLKDVDSVSRSQFLKGFAWAFFIFGLLGFIFGLILGGVFYGLLGLIGGAIVALFISLITMFISDKIGGLAGIVYRGFNPGWKLREQLAGSYCQELCMEKLGGDPFFFNSIDKVYSPDYFC